FANEKRPIKLRANVHPLLQDYRYFIPVYHKDQALAYVFVGDLTPTDRIIKKNKIKYIQTLINVVIVAFENKKLFKERIHKERLQKEIELAGKVQSMFIPGELPMNPIFEHQAVYL